MINYLLPIPKTNASKVHCPSMEIHVLFIVHLETLEPHIIAKDISSCRE